MSWKTAFLSTAMNLQYTSQNSGSTVTTSYLYRYQYENYGGKYFYDNDSSEWNMNGSSSYTGESSYDTLDFPIFGVVRLFR